MAIPILVFVVCFAAGVGASARWLPSLAAGPVGGLAFFAVCGLVGAGVAIVGVQIYDIVHTLDQSGLGGGLDKGVVVSTGLRGILFEAGTLFGLAVAVYLLAPAPDELIDEPLD